MEKSGAQQAIEKINDPCVILAGAGTGKTHTIVEKIKYLIQNKIYSPEKIICITFSNEAANSLFARVQRSLSFEENKEPAIKTFHAYSAQLLRDHAEKLGLKKDFKILDPDDAKVLLHQSLRVHPRNCSKYVNAFNTAKDLGITLQELDSFVQSELNSRTDEQLSSRLENLQFELQTACAQKTERKKILVSDIFELKKLLDRKRFISAWRAYEKIKQINNYQDYADLNANALLLLQKFPEIAKTVDYLIVDEFQDTNKVQLELIFALASHRNITIVGDLNQSIYRFRGAYKDNFRIFLEKFRVPKENLFALDKSYRSPNTVLKTAHKLICNNYKNAAECFPVRNANNKNGEKIKVYELLNAREEARKIVEIIRAEREKSVPYEEICIMVRAHQYNKIIKYMLEKNNIPFCSVKSSLLQQKSVRLILNYLKILNSLKNHKVESTAWWDLLFLNGLPKIDLATIGKFIKENKKSENLSALILTQIEQLPMTEVGKRISQNIIKNLKLLIPHSSQETSEILEETYRILGLVNECKSREEKQAMLNLNKLHEIAKEHSVLHDPSLNNFLNYLATIESLDIILESPVLESTGVRLMTLHATKGLEYSVVIITNLANNRFPIEKIKTSSIIPIELTPELKEIIKQVSPSQREDFIKTYEQRHQLLEERRLCYVAFTRAKERLYLTYAKNYNNKTARPSIFLEEINFQENPEIEFEKDHYEKTTEEQKQEIPQIFVASEPEISPQVDLKKIVFSPTALLLFKECQKKFEYVHLFGMPEKKTHSWQEARLGSFIHVILEKGVKEKFTTLKEFLDTAKLFSLEEEWSTVDLQEVTLLLRVFFERNKSKYSSQSKTEQPLSLNLAGLRFFGIADRIDFSPAGLEIIDYKTNKSNLTPLYRDWQLGYYALAAQKIGKVKRLTLEMLRQPTSLEFDLSENGDAIARHNSSMRFNLTEVKKQLIHTAEEIIEAHKHGFKTCPHEKNCEFCSEL